MRLNVKTCETPHYPSVSKMDSEESLQNKIFTDYLAQKSLNLRTVSIKKIQTPFHKKCGEKFIN